MNLPLDETLSRQVAEQIKSKARQPFENAHKAALVTAGATYVQGFLIYASKPYRLVEHSWLEVNGAIVDPNLPHLEKKGRRVNLLSSPTVDRETIKGCDRRSQRRLSRR